MRAGFEKKEDRDCNHDQTIKATDNKILEETINHMCTAMSLPLPSPTCSECGKHEFYPNELEIEAKFELVLARLSKLEEKPQNETTTETSVVTENNKMVAEIEYLKATVAELREENDGIKTLDIKQNEWIQIDSRQSSNKPTTTAFPPTTIENHFDALTIKDPVAELERDSLPGCPDKANNNNDKPKRNYFKSSKTQGYQSKPQTHQEKLRRRHWSLGIRWLRTLTKRKLKGQQEARPFSTRTAVLL